MASIVWNDDGQSVLDAAKAMVAAVSKAPLPTEPLVLTMPAWAYPAGLSHDQFRATGDAADLRQLGYGSIVWIDQRGSMVRLIQL